MPEADEQGVVARIDRLETRIDARFEAVDRRFEAVDRRFEAVDRRFDAMDLAIREAFDEQRRFITDGLSSVWREMAAFRRDMAAGFAAVHDRLDRFETKFDAFIQVQSELNRRFVDHLEGS